MNKKLKVIVVIATIIICAFVGLAGYEVYKTFNKKDSNYFQEDLVNKNSILKLSENNDLNINSDFVNKVGVGYIEDTDSILYLYYNDDGLYLQLDSNQSIISNFNEKVVQIVDSMNNCEVESEDYIILTSEGNLYILKGRNLSLSTHRFTENIFESIKRNEDISLDFIKVNSDTIKVLAITNYHGDNNKYSCGLETTLVYASDKTLRNYNDFSVYEKDLNISKLDDLGEELFKMTKVGYMFDRYLFYDYKDIKYDDLSNYDRLKAAYSFIESIYVFDDTFSTRDECFEGINDGEMIKCAREKVSIDIFEEYYHKLFGNDKKIIYEDFSNNYGDSCFIENNEIDCYPYSPATGGEAYSTINYINYDSIERNNNEIIIYVSQFISNYNNDTKRDEIYKEYNADGNLKNKIAEVENGLSSTEMFEKYSNQTSKYKVTFKKEENISKDLKYIPFTDLVNNDYYWYSVEYIK